jgi:hypothetical protein
MAMLEDLNKSYKHGCREWSVLGLLCADDEAVRLVGQNKRPAFVLCAGNVLITIRSEETTDK